MTNNPANQWPQSTPPPPVFDPNGPTRLQSMREQIYGTDAPFVQAGPPLASAFDPHLVEVGYTPELWSLVGQILGVVQNHEEVSRWASRMVLTRDKDTDSAQRENFTRLLTPILARYPEYASLPMLNQIMSIAYDELLGISVLGPIWRDDDVTEILVDAWDRVVIERNGRLEETNPPIKFRDPEHARKIARDLALKVSDRALTPANPLVTAELPGARVAFAIDKVVKSGLSVSMRKFRPLLNMEGLLSMGALDTEMRDFLADCVRARANVLVSGGTGTGKTTMINALSTFIPHSERVITIEDAYELKMDTPHWVALQTKEAASADDEVVVTMADLLVTVLRMRPDRIIVGEIREPKGASVMLQAANTGHDGTMTTIHANTADRALNFRMVSFARTGAAMTAEVAAAEVSSAINLVVQVVRRAGRRYISEVAVVDPSCLTDGLIKPVAVFSGSLIDGHPQFSKVGSVPPATELGMKLDELGLLGKWSS